MIIVECNNDEFVLLVFGVGKKRIKHESCKGDVLRKAGKNSPVLAFIDDDPDSEQPRELSKYLVTSEGETLKHGIHSDDPHRRIIIVSPYLERWLLIRAKRSGINPKTYGLPDEPKELKSIPHLEKNKGFKQFVEDLTKKDAEIAKILNWISDYRRIE
ncbi:MAG: hypothetical protein Q7V05_15955 [Methanoregula sp.]|nr:hypothetical protein [Methanoregula sp.]MDP2798243.1 hypothetical protein [Methanoregula sp.]